MTKTLSISDWGQWTTGSTNWAHGCIQPEQTLYFFDAPVIFSTQIGLQKYLFFKSDEIGNSDFFFASETSEDALLALMEGRLSVRGALMGDTIWLMELSFRREVLRFENFAISVVSSLLPEAGIAIGSNFGKVPDTLEQATSDFSFRFFGNKIMHGSMPFSVFKSITDEVYGIVRKAFTPEVISSNPSFLSFPIHAPSFTSLLISLDAPKLDREKVKTVKDFTDQQVSELEREVEARGVAFFKRLESLITDVSEQKVNSAHLPDEFDLIQSIVQIMPGEGGPISRLEVTTNRYSAREVIEIDERSGDSVREYFNSVKRSVVRVSGTIIGIAKKRHTMILQSNLGREVTCAIDQAIFDQMLVTGELKIGQRVLLEGAYTKRTRRDYIAVNGHPTILS